MAAALAASCSVKEDRSPCPCWLTVELGDAARTAPDVSVSLWEDGRAILAETASPEETYERTVPRGIVTTAACTGLGGRIPADGTVAFTRGEKIDTLWSHTASVDCRDEHARDTARLHRQFAVARLVLEGAPGEDRETGYRVETGCGGLDLLTQRPVAGDWGMPLELSESRGCLFAVPRLTGDCRFSIVVTDESGLEDEIDLQPMLREQGYSWAKKDLDDMVIRLDHARGEASVTVLSWKEGHIYDERI